MTDQLQAMNLNKLPVGDFIDLKNCDVAHILDLALGGKDAFRQENFSRPDHTFFVRVTKIRATGMETASQRAPGKHPALAAPYGRTENLTQGQAQDAHAAFARAVKDSRDHGEQPDTPEGWDGERRARYWQTRAYMTENALAALVAFHRTTQVVSAAYYEDSAALVEAGDRALAESRKLDQGFDVAAWMRERQQEAVVRWAARAFGQEVVESAPERALRMFEEAAELYQAVIFAYYRFCPEESADQTRQHDSVQKAHEKAMTILNLRWDAEPGGIESEAGGLMVTLSALAGVVGINLHTAEDHEFTRVLAKPQSHWTARQEEKRGQGLTG